MDNRDHRLLRFFMHGYIRQICGDIDGIAETFASESAIPVNEQQRAALQKQLACSYLMKTSPELGNKFHALALPKCAVPDCGYLFSPEDDSCMYCPALNPTTADGILDMPASALAPPVALLAEGLAVAQEVEGGGDPTTLLVNEAPQVADGIVDMPAPALAPPVPLLAEGLAVAQEVALFEGGAAPVPPQNVGMPENVVMPNPFFVQFWADVPAEDATKVLFSKELPAKAVRFREGATLDIPRSVNWFFEGKDMVVITDVRGVHWEVDVRHEHARGQHRLGRGWTSMATEFAAVLGDRVEIQMNREEQLFVIFRP